MNYEPEIILVEDSSSDAELAMRALKKHNLANKIVHLKDGQEALDYIFAEGIYAQRNMEDIPKVILLDLKMPKINGIQVLEKLKSNERTKKIPVIVLTSSKEDPDIQECYRLGVNSYVVKPVEFDKFISSVSELGLYWMVINQPPK
tara:strand:- start:662 stop:1099 length:438 start_codon:yes stop_codon:yes gene_type:complete